ncbi:MAG: STAS domain-containing protein [Clostridia bacterium]|nr:STAS domain-containing protein [Clostridia bacterium]
MNKRRWIVLKSFYLKPKLFSVMKNYSGPQLTKDIIAGVIVAIIALPLSIALALASGVEPACGVYTAIFAGFIVSFLGGSRVQIAGPTAAFASIVAGIVATQGMDGLVIATILAGIILVLMGVFKLGGLIKYIPYTITTGFTSGIAVTILIGQVKDFLGLQYADGVKPVETVEKIEANIHAMGSFSWQALLVGLVCLAILIIYPKLEKRVPPSLIAVIAGVLMVKFIPGLDEGVFTIGELYTIPSGLPKFALAGMDISFSKITAVVPDAFTIAILAAIESLLSCVVADGMVNSKHNPNAELVAQGAGNIASVLFGGIPATGAIARTAANAKNGGRTPVAGMVHAVVLLIVLLFLMPLAGLIPMPTIAAILFMVAYNMSEWKKFVHTVKTAPKSDILVLVVTFLLTVIFDLVVAIAVGMVLAAVLLMKRVSDESGVASWKYDVEDDSDMLLVPDNVRVFEVNGPMFFGAADKLLDVNLKEYTTVLILRMRSMTAIDATALNSLEHLADRCDEKGVKIILSHVNSQPLKAMKKSGFYKRIGAQNFMPDITSALTHAKNI